MVQEPGDRVQSLQQVDIVDVNAQNVLDAVEHLAANTQQQVKYRSTKSQHKQQLRGGVER